MPHRGGLVTALAVIGALLAGNAAEAKPVGFRHVATGSASNAATAPPGASARIARDAGSARALFQAWGMNRARVTGVDFRRRSLIVLIDAWMPDPAYVDLVGAVDVVGGTATLTATLFRRSGTWTTVVARPWAIVSVPRAAVTRVGPDLRVVMRCAVGARLCRLIEA